MFLKQSLLQKKSGLVVAPSGPGLSKDLLLSDSYRKALSKAELILPDSGLMCLWLKIFGKNKLQRLSGLKFLNKFLENITIIENDLVSIFEKNNIKKISTKNKKFDPNLHQAMTEIEDDKAESGIILQEIQAGYMLGERLLRPALVGVAKKKKSKNEEK